MIKTFKYRIFPTNKQTSLLSKQLEACRWLYNHFLAERRDSYPQTGKAPNYHAQAVSIPTLKPEKPELGNVHSQVLQNVAVRVDLAFQAFFRRVKSGEKEVGYPRFKSYGRYDSMTFPQVQTGGCTIKGDMLVVNKVGHVRIVLHRKLEGLAKTAVFSRSSTGKWYVCFSCAVEPKPLPKLPNRVGIDVGLKTFATLSDGTEIENPRFFRKEEKALAKVSRKLSKEAKGTPERKFRRKAVARTHERIKFRRDNFSHQHSRKIVNGYGSIFVEDLTINRLVKNRKLSKSISDAAWSEFFSKLFAKAEEAGRIIIAVNPVYTSQTCADCGYRRTGEEKLSLSDRIFICPSCNLHLDRDLNASLNILAVGLHSFGEIPLDDPSFCLGQ